MDAIGYIIRRGRGKDRLGILVKNQTTQYISDVGPSGPFVGAICDRWNLDNRLYNTFFRIPITKENSTCRNDTLPKARYGHGFCGFFSGVDCAVQLKFAGITFHNPESRARSLFGECAGYEEFTGAEDSRAGKSVADEAAYLRLIAQFISAVTGSPHPADVLAATARSGAGGWGACPTDAEGADADEPPAGQCDQ